MKTILLIILSCLFLNGCATRQATSTDLIKPGKNITCFDGYVLHVTKREGNLLEGVRLVIKSQEGPGQTVTAKTGNLSKGPVAGTWLLVLHDAKIQLKDGRTGTAREFRLSLQK